MPERSPVIQRFGEATWYADSALLALACAGNKTVWSVEEPGVLQHWDARGKLLSRHELSDFETIWAFDGAAKLLASGADELVIFDVTTREVAQVFENPSWITALAFHPDGQRIATGHDDGVVRVWNLDSPDDFAELAHHDRPISAVAFTSDGEWLAAASEDRTISVWNTGDRKLVRTLKGHTDRIPALTWQPGTRRLVSAGWDTTARLWNVETGEPLMLLNSHSDQVVALAFSPDGQLLAVADSAATIHVWSDVAQGRELHVLPGDLDEVRALSFSPDGSRLFVGGADRVIHVWDVRKGELVAGQGAQSSHQAAISPHGKNGLLVGTAAGTQLQCWDLATGKSTELSGKVAKPLAVAASPDGRWIAATNADPESRLHIWDNTARQLRDPVEGPRAPMTYLAFSPDSKTLASCCRTDGTAWLWDPADGEPKLIIPEAAEGCTVEVVAFHSNGTWLACGGIDWLATGGSDGAVSIWNVVSRERLVTFDGGALSLAFDPPGHRLAVATPESILRVFDLQSRQAVLEVASPGAELRAVAWSRDGHWIVTGGDDRALRIWDALTGKAVNVVKLDSPIRSLVFDGSGATLVAALGNSTCSTLSMAALISS